MGSSFTHIWELPLFLLFEDTLIACLIILGTCIAAYGLVFTGTLFVHKSWAWNQVSQANGMAVILIALLCPILMTGYTAKSIINGSISGQDDKSFSLQCIHPASTILDSKLAFDAIDDNHLAQFWLAISNKIDLEYGSSPLFNSSWKMHGDKRLAYIKENAKCFPILKQYLANKSIGIEHPDLSYQQRQSIAHDISRVRFKHGKEKQIQSLSFWADNYWLMSIIIVLITLLILNSIAFRDIKATPLSIDWVRSL